MTTTKSYSDRSRFFSVYRSALKNQIPFAIIVAIIYATLLPLVFLVSFTSHKELGISGAAQIKAYYSSGGNVFLNGPYLSETHAVFIYFTLIALAIVIALIQNAYMHSKKMTDLYHSLPVRRPHLMGANMLASLSTILGPFLAVYFITVLLQLLQYGAYLPIAQYLAYIGYNLLGILIGVTVVYLFTTFIAVNVGTVFDAFALTGLLGILLTVTFLVFGAFWGGMTYGAVVPFSNSMLLFSPFSFGFHAFLYLDGFDYRNVGHYDAPAILGGLALWALIGVALWLGAVACYNRRKSEIAEQVQTTGVFQTIAKCFGAFCGSAIFFGIFYGKTGSVLSWILASLFGAVFLGTIGELILSRGIRAVRKNCKWLLISGAFFCVVMLAFRFDLPGYSTQVPAPDSVQKVSVHYRGRFEILSEMEGSRYRIDLTEPADIAILTEAHRLAVEDQPPKDYEERSMDYEDHASRYPYHWLDITYELKNGKTLSRQYGRLNTDALLKLTELEAADEFIIQNHALFEMGIPDSNAAIQNITLYDALGGGGKPYRLSKEDTDRLAEAARRDMLEESLEEIRNPTKPVVGHLEFQYNYNLRSRDDASIGYADVIVTQGYSRTLAVLAELDMMDAFELDTSRIDAATFHLAPYEFWQTTAVVAVTPQTRNGPGANREYYRDSPSTQDKGTILSLIEAGASQMLHQGDYYSGSDTVVVRYFAGEEYVGMQLVRWEKLPEEVQLALWE